MEKESFAMLRKGNMESGAFSHLHLYENTEGEKYINLRIHELIAEKILN